MFKNLMAKFGQGGAKIDLVLHKHAYTLGETVSRELIILGGTVEQHINRIDIELLMNVHAKGRHYTQVIQAFPFHTPFQIRPSERKTFPFSYVLPHNLLLSSHSVSYYFLTHLDIAGAVDSSDQDFITITPPPQLNQVLTALSQLGFREKHDSRSFDGHVQEFTLAPTSFLKDRVEEIEFVVALEPQGIRLWLEVDLYSFMGEKEIKREIWLDNQLLADPSHLLVHLQQILTEMVNETHTHKDYGFGGHFGHHGHHGYHGHHGHHGHHHGHHGHHKHHAHHGLTGAIGGFAAGIIADEILDELFDDDNQDNDSDDDGGLFDDFFGGDED